MFEVINLFDLIVLIDPLDLIDLVNVIDFFVLIDLIDLSYRPSRILLVSQAFKFSGSSYFFFLTDSHLFPFHLCYIVKKMFYIF